MLLERMHRSIRVCSVQVLTGTGGHALTQKESIRNFRNARMIDSQTNRGILLDLSLK